MKNSTYNFFKLKQNLSFLIINIVVLVLLCSVTNILTLMNGFVLHLKNVKQIKKLNDSVALNIKI